jgi:hypothetical protein
MINLNDDSFFIYLYNINIISNCNILSIHIILISVFYDKIINSIKLTLVIIKLIKLQKLVKFNSINLKIKNQLS